MSRYLMQVAIQDFRCIGSLNISLPAPGVLILAGPNGLGKSSFFEAIEWALDGNVKRVDIHRESKRDQPHRYLARIDHKGIPVESFSVSLTFSGTPESSIVVQRFVSKQPRGAGYEETCSPVSDISNWIVSPGWIINPELLTTYLRLTHILPQPREQQFLWQEGIARWSSLQEPAGLHRLTVIQDRLRRVADSKGPLIRRSEQLEADLARLEVKLDTWQKLLADRAAASAQAYAGGALPPEEVHRQLELAARDLKLGSAMTLKDKSLESLQAYLHSIRDAMFFRRDELKRQEEYLREVEAIWPKYNQAHADIAAKQIEVRRLEDVTQQLTEKVRTQEVELSKLQKEQSAAIDSVLNSQAAKDRFENIANVWIARNTLMIELGNVHGVLAEAKNNLTEIEESYRRAVSLRDWHRIKHERLSAISLEKRTVEAALAEIQGFRAREPELEVARDRSEFIRLEIQSIEKSLQTYAKERDSLRLEINRHDSIVDQRRSRSNERQRLIAQLGALLGAKEQHCPLCRTEFHAAGELLNRVRQSFHEKDNVLSEMETRAVSLRNAILEKEQQIASSKEKLNDAIKQLDQLNEQLQAAHIRESKIRQMAIFSELSTTNGIEELRESALMRLRQASVDEKLILDEIAKEKQISEIDREIDNQQHHLISAQNLAGEISDKYIKINERIAQLTEELASPSGDRTTWDISGDFDIARHRSHLFAKHGEMVGARQLIEQTISHSVENLNFVREQLLQSAADREKILAEIKELQSFLSDMQRQWNVLDLADTPNLQDLQARITKIHLQYSTLEPGGRFESNLDILTKALAQWQGTLILQNKQEEIDRLLQAESGIAEHEYQEKIITEKNRAQALIDDIRAVVAQARELVALLKRETAEYADSVLAPLNDKVESILNALSSTRSWKTKDELQRTSGRGQIKTFAYWGVRNGDESHPLDVKSVLSEGQLAAVSLAQLISMSTSWRWSHWPALLLDDPVQYNDIVHVAAFIDLIRNLVRHEKYQMIISTHDLETAGYFRRKLQAIGLPCKTLRFVSQGPKGVETTIEE